MKGDDNNAQADIPQQPTTKRPSAMRIQQLQKIQNNLFLNQNIYQLFMMGRHAQCLQMIQKCKPDQFKMYMRALIYQQKFQLQKSLALLTECQLMNKFNFAYLKNMAKNFYLLGKYKSSLEAAKQAFKLNTSDYQIFYIMSKIAAGMKDTDGAISHLGRAISKQPNQQSYIYLANLHIERENYRQAEQQLKLAASISPENNEIQSLLGKIQLKIGTKQQALRYYSNAVSINSSNYESLFSIAAIKQSQNQLQQALQQYKKAYKVTQNSALMWSNLAALLAKKNKDIAAYSCLKKALFLDQFRQDTHTNMGILMLKYKKFVAAQLHFRSSLKLNKDPAVFNLLAVSLAQLGDFNNSLKCYQQIFKIANKVDINRYKVNQLCLLAKKGDVEKCKNLIEELQKYEQKMEAILNDKIKQIKRMF